MTCLQTTDRLIRSLAIEAERCGDVRGPTVRRALVIASVTAFALAAVASLSLFATMEGLAHALEHHWLYQKLLCTSACAVGAWFVVEDLARPERNPVRYAALLPAIILFTAGALYDPSGVALHGRSASSVPACLSAIVLLSLPGLALLLAGLRRAAATTRPMSAGAAVGLLAGALGATAYAFTCRNDGGLFVLVWYGCAIALTTAVGGFAGRTALAW